MKSFIFILAILLLMYVYSFETIDYYFSTAYSHLYMFLELNFIYQTYLNTGNVVTYLQHICECVEYVTRVTFCGPYM